MGAPVPYMAPIGTRRVGDGVVFAAEPKACTCTQCGAPHEARASVCAYCLSPKFRESTPPMVTFNFAVGDVATTSQVRAAVQATLARSRAYNGSLWL